MANINFMVPVKAGSPFERSNKILDLIFGHGDHCDLNDQFSVFNSLGNNCGKIYLPLSVSLEHLVAQQDKLGFDIHAEVRQNKVVLHY